LRKGSSFKKFHDLERLQIKKQKNDEERKTRQDSAKHKESDVKKIIDDLTKLSFEKDKGAEDKGAEDKGAEDSPSGVSAVVGYKPPPTQVGLYRDQSVKDPIKRGYTKQKGDSKTLDTATTAFRNLDSGLVARKNILAVALKDGADSKKYEKEKGVCDDFLQ